jgi:hypothetical protein
MPTAFPLSTWWMFFRDLLLNEQESMYERHAALFALRNDGGELEMLLFLLFCSSERQKCYRASNPVAYISTIAYLCRLCTFVFLLSVFSCNL